MALFSLETLRTFYASMLPWSAPHPNRGKLVPLSDRDFKLAGYSGIFRRGDIVFVRTREPDSDRTHPAIYAVSKVVEWSARKGFQIYWKLRMIGGYGNPKIDLYYDHPYGENPGVYSANWFIDYGHGPLPKLNYYTIRIVSDGKTIWDVEDRLRQGIR
jgi:hypothetical protein